MGTGRGKPNICPPVSTVNVILKISLHLRTQKRLIASSTEFAKIFVDSLNVIT